MKKNLKNKKKGFTLIELIIVIAIIAIIAAIALPRFGEVRKTANINADIANAKQIQGAASMVIAEGKVTLPTTDAVFILDDQSTEGEIDPTGIETEIIKQLQGSIPKLKAVDKGKSFKVEVTPDGTITIYAPDTANTRIYPNGQGDYVEK